MSVNPDIGGLNPFALAHGPHPADEVRVERIERPAEVWIQEDIHPNYWGQLALRDCLRQAYNGGAPRGGTCSIAGTGLNSRGEPLMTLR